MFETEALNCRVAPLRTLAVDAVTETETVCGLPPSDPAPPFTLMAVEELCVILPGPGSVTLRWVKIFRPAETVPIIFALHGDTYLS